MGEELSVMQESLLRRLPEVRGKLRENVDLSATNWFRVGGPAEVVFRPADSSDLCHFLAHLPTDIPLTLLGVGSNVIVRDGGIAGVVIRLGRAFTQLKIDADGVIEVGAAVMDAQLAQFAAEHGISGLEFMVGIPGGIGGALAMNAGAYGSDVASQLVAAEYVDRSGKVHKVAVADIEYGYRHCGLSNVIFTRGWFRGQVSADSESICQRMEQIMAERSASQPVRSRTGGSTFRNPEGHKAWQLIDAAGCRGLVMGGAQVSEQHCNFLINTGKATAHDLETLGEEVRARVFANSGVELQWEIKRIGIAGRNSD